MEPALTSCVCVCVTIYTLQMIIKQVLGNIRKALIFSWSKSFKKEMLKSLRVNSPGGQCVILPLTRLASEPAHEGCSGLSSVPS